MIVPNTPLRRARWSRQPSGGIAITDVPSQERKRSAREVQQDVSNLPPTWTRDRSAHRVKGYKLCVSVSSLGGAAIERKGKDSKMVDLEDMINHHPQFEEVYLSSSSWDEDPYLNDPDATMHFLEVFFAQSAHEVSIMFPRRAFARWVRQWREKRRRECMVLYAILALGSIYADNRFSAFAKLCVERAAQAVCFIDGKFSMAVIQARLLVAAYKHLIGEDSASWELSGSALGIIRAMRLNSEEGCGEHLDDATRRYYNFSREQLKECRRRTFWTAFLVDVSTVVNSCELILTSTSDIKVSAEGFSVPYS